MKIAIATAIAFLIAFSAPILAQTSVDSRKAVCSFEDGRQIGVRYQRLPVGSVLPVGQIWPPKDGPILLFTETTLSIGGTVVQPGAYAVFTVPQKQRWTLVVNKQVSPGKPYDAGQRRSTSANGHRRKSTFGKAHPNRLGTHRT